MISDQMRQLLAAYVDGELPARQREAATRLLEQSAEAREFVRHLEADAAALRRLPRRQLAPDFSEKVLGAIGDRRPHGFRHARLARAPVYPAWIGVAAAASVLFVLGVGSTLYFYALPARQDKVVIAKNDGLRLDNPPQAPADTQRKSSTPSPQENQPPDLASNPPESNIYCI
jgi:anti-sigma factor RsiW